MRDQVIDIGIDRADRQPITDGLARLLADTYTLYLKTHNYHWNVTGPMFQTLHLMFETQYNELALAVDLIAERIRALGAPAPGSYREFGCALLGGRRRRPSRRRRDDPPPRHRPRDRGPHRPIDVPCRRASPRRADRGSAHPASPDPREDGLDAPEPPGLRRFRATCLARWSGEEARASVALGR